MTELRDQAANSATSDPGALVRLALGMNQNFDPASVPIIESALASDSVEVRNAAATAAALLAWPELKSSISQRLRLEDNPSTRRLLTYAFNKLSRTQ